MKHLNNGDCPKCEAIFKKYDGFYQPLKDWFKKLQKEFPEAHISEAGRDEDTQNILFNRKATRAKFGQSAHNYNAAIDIFVQGFDQKTIYPRDWYNSILTARLTENINWYGSPGSSFFELPHVEWRDWKKLVLSGDLKLIGSKE